MKLLKQIYTENDEARTKFCIVFYKGVRRGKKPTYFIHAMNRLSNLISSKDTKTVMSYRLKLGKIYKRINGFLADKKLGLLTQEERVHQRLELEKRIYYMLKDIGLNVTRRESLSRYMASSKD